MKATKLPFRPHRHHVVVERVVVQRAGIPYELERRSCASCGRQLGERLLGRTLA